MRKIQLLIFFISFLSCKEQHKANLPTTTTNQDSVLFYHDLATKQGESLLNKKTSINKAFHFVDKNDSLYALVLQQKTILHYSLKEYDSLLYYSKKLSTQANTERDAYYLGKHYHLMAFYYEEIIQSSDSAYYFYNLSKDYFQQINDSSGVGKRLLSLAKIQKNQNDYFGSKETVTDALRFLKVSRDDRFIASCYNTLGTNHRKLFNYIDAIYYKKKAIENTPSKRDLLVYKNNLAATYIDFEKYPTAIKLLQEIKNDTVLKKNSSQRARIMDNLAYAQWLNGDNIKAHSFQKPLNVRILNNDKRGQIASYTHLMEFFTTINPEKAKACFDTIVQLSRLLKIPKAEKDVLKQMMQLEPSNIEFKDRYVFLQDSMYEQELKVKTQFAKYRYDDQLKQESILRLEKEKMVQTLEMQEERSLKVSSFYGVGFLVVLFGFSIYYFRQRSKHLKQLNKTAKIEATFETEEELSRKLHDDFGGKLNHTMLLLQNNADTSKVLDVVEGLYNQSRDFSRKINDVDTGPNFKNLLLGMLGTYSKDTKLVLTGSTTLDWNNLSELAKKTLYRVLQELMSNMQKYSKASLVNINFDQTNKILKVNYSDNGVGATKNNLNNRNGLWNTEKRIQAIGGTIIFDSEKGKGFKSEIKIPN